MRRPFRCRAARVAWKAAGPRHWKKEHCNRVDPAGERFPLPRSASARPRIHHPNPWDAGAARLLARMGFEALATTSAGYAFSGGLQDGAVGREAMLKHVAAQEMQQHCTFRFAKDLIPYKEINDMFEP
jgi:hypothetical protein